MFQGIGDKIGVWIGNREPEAKTQPELKGASES
jgi:hypothetical protein